MTNELLEFLELGQKVFHSGFLVFLRVGAVMAVLPAFGDRSVPQKVRLFLAGAFTLIVFPAVDGDVRLLSESQVASPVTYLVEIVVGLALGITIRLYVSALYFAGAMVAQAISLSQILGVATEEPSPAVGQLMAISGLALAVSLGLHVKVAEAMILSYQYLPLGQLLNFEALSSWNIGTIARVFGLAFSLAAPFLIASLVYNVALGVINKAMPQLMVAFVGAPAITASGIFLLFLSLPLLLSVWSGVLDGVLANPFEAQP